MVKLSGGGHFFLLPATADPRLVPGETIVGLVQANAGSSNSSSSAASVASVSRVLLEGVRCWHFFWEGLVRPAPPVEVWDVFLSRDCIVRPLRP